jgi:hypothetical protein
MVPPAAWAPLVQGRQPRAWQRDGTRDPVSGRLDWIVGKMRIARGRLHVRVPEKSANDRQGVACGKTHAGVRMAQIMKTQLGKSGLIPCFAPNLFDTLESSLARYCGKHERRITYAFQNGQNLERRGAERDDFLPRFGIF